MWLMTQRAQARWWGEVLDRTAGQRHALADEIEERQPQSQRHQRLARRLRASAWRAEVRAHSAVEKQLMQEWAA